MHVLEDLDGTNCARGIANADGITLTLLAASGFGTQGTFFPAESLTIETVAAVKALHELCGRLIEAHEEATGGGEA